MYRTELNKVGLSEIQLALMGNGCYPQRCIPCWFWNGVEIRLVMWEDEDTLDLFTSGLEIPDLKGFPYHISPAQSRQESCCWQAFPRHSFHYIYLFCACSVLSLPGYLNPISNGEAGNEAVGPGFLLTTRPTIPYWVTGTITTSYQGSCLTGFWEQPTRPAPVPSRSFLGSSLLCSHYLL